MPQRRQGRSFTILGDAQLIHAGQHVAQLHDEGGIDAYAGIRITTLAVVPGHGIGQAKYSRSNEHVPHGSPART